MKIKILVSPRPAKMLPLSAPIAIAWRNSTLVVTYDQSVSTEELLDALQSELRKREDALRPRRMLKKRLLEKFGLHELF